ncbi:MAG: hypothetical protein NZM11_07255 [Anaerolineales bacterium]|nr:hypothetical protein [Anaerolineales bacterium]
MRKGHTRTLHLRGDNARAADFSALAGEEGPGFDPEARGRSDNVACPFCGMTEDSADFRHEGEAGRLGHQLITVIRSRKGEQGRVYLAAV